MGPVNNLMIPEWDDLVYRGLWHEALERLHKEGQQFPRIYRASIAPHALRSGLRAWHQQPAGSRLRISSARSSNFGFNQGWVAPRAARRNARPGKKVAVVEFRSGRTFRRRPAQQSRPSGSPYLNDADRIGGLLMYGIPNMKLEKSTVQRRVRSAGTGKALTS